jgi:Cell wall-active antibiotics response 4TMS YvqF
MGDSKRQGRWRVERPLAAVAVMGDVVLDLRGAEVPHGDVEITATAVMGDVKIYVPDGVDVQLSGIAVMGDKQVQVREAAAGQTAPKVVVRATVVMGDVKVLGDSYAEPARRTLRAWLTGDDHDRRAIE